MRRVVGIAVVVLVFCVALGALGRRLRGPYPRRTKAIRRAIGGVLFIAYAYGVLTQTILGRLVKARSSLLELLWSYRASFALTERGITVTNTVLLTEILLNVLLFAPLGALLPFLAPNLFSTERVARDAVRVAIVACAMSLAIELSQRLFHLGQFELDDILNNTIGALLGFAAYRIAFRIAQRVWG